MKQIRYNFYFSNGDIDTVFVVDAFCAYDAVIIAKANRIENGQHADIKHIHDENGRIYTIKTDLQVR